MGYFTDQKQESIIFRYGLPLDFFSKGQKPQQGLHSISGNWIIHQRPVLIPSFQGNQYYPPPAPSPTPQHWNHPKKEVLDPKEQI